MNHIRQLNRFLQAHPLLSAGLFALALFVGMALPDAFYHRNHFLLDLLAVVVLAPFAYAIMSSRRRR